MSRIPFFSTLSLLALALVPWPVWSQSIVLNQDEQRVFQEFNWIPYAFFSESFGLGFGAGGSYAGWPQEQASVLGAVTVGTKGSYNVVGGMSDYQVPGMPRLVIDPLFAVGRYQDQRLYIGRNPDFDGERASANDSDEDHYIEATQWDNWARLDFRYLLPLGHGRDTLVSRYIIRQGLLVSGESGATDWNPLASGRTTVSLRPAWREQTLERGDVEVPFETINLELALEHNNFDFPFNPTRGSFKRVAFKRDFDDDENLGEWDLWTGELGQVIDLGRSDRFDQRVLALGWWTANVPTWETEVIDGRERTIRRPPHFEGATLGGIRRMRAYEDERWQDKAAMYYSVEARVMPVWKPYTQYDWLDWADLSWWQWVAFFEMGQVSPSYNLSDLHDDLHVSGGISLRVMSHKAVCRLDFAFGEEGGRVVAMYGHPF